MAPSASTTTASPAESARDALKTLVDEMRVQMHLAGMDAKGAWEDMEPQLRRMETRLDEVSQRLKQAGEEGERQTEMHRQPLGRDRDPLRKPAGARQRCRFAGYQLHDH